MTWYEFAQNNSVGKIFPPAEYLFVEADYCSDAERIAQEHGVYFNGVDKGLDCSCCGDRWYEPTKANHPKFYFYSGDGEYKNIDLLEIKEGDIIELNTWNCTKAICKNVKETGNKLYFVLMIFANGAKKALEKME